MTALSEYQRLEAPGLWRSAPGAQRRDVIVSVGEASLVITDMSDRALAHWSLPAVQRVNPGASPARYVPGEDATEDLEIEDPTMTAAIERVRAAVARRRPQPGRLRQSLLLGFLAVLLVGGVVWLPGALIRHTASVVPPGQRALIGDALLAEIGRATGGFCETARGARALDRLREHLLGPEIRRLVVVPGGIAATAHLPGGTILLSHRVLDAHDMPDVAASYILAEAERAAAKDPLLRMLEDAGAFAAFRLLTTGRISDPVLVDHAETLMSAAPPPVDPLRAGAAVGEPILSDGDWVALQGICGE